VRLIELPDTIDLVFDETELPDDGRHEPLFATVARPADDAELVRLDPTRSDLGRDPTPAEDRVWRGPIGSLLLHFLPLLALIGWLHPPLEITPPIPIQLVIEQPPPPPPQPAQPAKPPPGVRASDDFGEVEKAKAERKTDTPATTPGEPQPPAAETQTAAAAPDPLSPLTPPADPLTTPFQPLAPETRLPPAAPVQPPKPAPPKQQAAVRMPKPEGGAWPLPLSPDRPHEVSHSARLPGPDATRDEYCVYALSLTMAHIDLLPLSLLGARHGDTYVTIHVLGDGTISSVRVMRGSGYMDIDDRVRQMVVAVGRFPPLPLWITGRAMDFTFHLHFPHPSER
jgi:hypothetical protein